MRYFISILILLAITLYFVFIHPARMIDYPVGSRQPEGQSEIRNQNIRYHAESVRRFFGADIYRNRCYYTHEVHPLHVNDSTATRKGRLRNALRQRASTLRLQLLPGQVLKLGLYPQFTVWEEYGRWFFAAMLVILLYFAVIRRPRIIRKSNEN